MLHLPDRVDSAALISDLRARRIHADCRGSILRLSPGVVTRAEHVARLFDALDVLTAH
jgi:hypothetical protein